MNETNNPHSNFDPAEYSVVDYLDNRRPQYMGGPVEYYVAEVKRWEEDIAYYFPHWKSACTHPTHNIHRCHHCGNGTVRYISVVEHLPSKALIVFGSECTHHLGFADRHAFKLAQIKSRAEQGHARLRVWNTRTQFLAANPKLAAIIESKPLEQTAHAQNAFARDILAKLDQYGSLSERQVECLIESLERDTTRVSRKAQDEIEKAALLAAGVRAPEGRKTVEGTVVSTRVQESQFGMVYKWLVKLTDGTKVWTTIPTGLGTELKGLRVRFTATFEVSKDDQLFAFGKRPTKASVLS